MRLWFALLTSSLLIFSVSGCTAFKSAGVSSFWSKDKDSAYNEEREDRFKPGADEILDPLGARNSDRILLEDLAPSQFLTTLEARFGAVDYALSETQFLEAKSLYNSAVAKMDADPEGTEFQKDFSEAAGLFRLAASTGPDSKIEEDSLYFAGESYFFADRYVQANREFEKLIAAYSGTRHIDQAELRRYSIAVYWLELADAKVYTSLMDGKRPKLGLKGEGRRVLNQIRIDDPTGQFADDAAFALGKSFMKSNRYLDAADTFEDLRKNYPGSTHQFAAHMLELEAWLQAYQGKEYDDKPLQKADDLLKNIVRVFPRESEQELDYLEQQAAKIQRQTADRDFSDALFYKRRGHNRAYQEYLEKIANRYPNQEVVEEINKEIERVATLPPDPKQPMKWLVDIFPNPEPAKPLINNGDNETIFK